ncbi:hypothetical protein [Kribbella steppae]|nr:hypothetical protein [Kribbella steppae]
MLRQAARRRPCGTLSGLLDAVLSAADRDGVGAEVGLADEMPKV